MAIDSKSLMLGDWVKYTNPPYIQVANITKKKIGYHIKPNEPRMHYVRTCEVEPIPLTPEILEKNGFYYGYTSNEEDLASNTIAQLSEEDKGWVWDEGAGSVKVIFPNESDGGEIQICDQCFDRDMTFSFVENIMLHELQHALKMCWIKKEIEL